MAETRLLRPVNPTVYTRPDRRSAGVASALLERSVEDMRSRGMEISLLFAARIPFYERLGWRDPAIAEYRRAVAIAPGYADAHSNLGVALAESGRLREALPHLAVEGGPGVAYTDGLLATKRGKMALTLSTWPPRDDAEPSHWHRMSDTIDNLDEASVLNAYEFAWQLLQEVDRA